MWRAGFRREKQLKSHNSVMTDEEVEFEIRKITDRDHVRWCQPYHSTAL